LLQLADGKLTYQRHMVALMQPSSHQLGVVVKLSTLVTQTTRLQNGT
jgi:hypothetical protein